MALFGSFSVPDHIAEIVFFLFKIGESMLEPSIRLYLYQGVCMSMYSNDSTCYNLTLLPDHEDNVQRAAANYMIAYKVLMNFPAIVLGFFCGAWSDIVGRKVPVLLTLGATILAVIMCLLSMTSGVDQAPYIPLVLLGAAIRGGFGKSAVITMALYSYTCDRSPKEKRTQKIGKLLSMNYFGYFIGSLSAGALLEVYGFGTIFSSVFVLNVVCIVLVLMFMEGKQEPLPPPIGEEDRAPVTKFPFQPAYFKDSVQLLTRSRYHRCRLHIILLFTLIFIQQTCKAGELDATLLFAEAAPLSWRKSIYGYLLATDYAFLGVAMLVILPCLIKYLHLQDMSLIMTGVAFRILRLIVLSFSNSTVEVYMSVIIGCPSALIVSCTKAMISKTVYDGEMGKAFSLLSCAETVSNLVGSIIFNNMYNATKHISPGFVFGMEAIFFVGLLFALALLGRDMKLAAQCKLQMEATGGAGPSVYGTVSPNGVPDDKPDASFLGPTTVKRQSGEGASAEKGYGPYREKDDAVLLNELSQQKNVLETFDYLRKDG